MEEYIAFDSHKRYTWVEREEVSSGKLRQYRLAHAPGAIRNALAGCAAGTVVCGEKVRRHTDTGVSVLLGGGHVLAVLS